LVRSTGDLTGSGANAIVSATVLGLVPTAMFAASMAFVVAFTLITRLVPVQTAQMLLNP